MTFEKSPLWTSAFKTDKSECSDAHTKALHRLSGCLVRARDTISSLISHIPSDCKDLTIHDVSHLDALWDIGSLIAGDSFTLNPAETFVFGVAVLIHDAGLSSIAYKEGLKALKETTEWQDVCAGTMREHDVAINPDSIMSPPPEIESIVKFEVLRLIHARQAENLAVQPWKVNDEQVYYIIDDGELRQAYGNSIGRIANSHNWSIERVAEELTASVGAGIGIPSSWSVNEKKVACLLRCADAVHIDRRRAPLVPLAAHQLVGKPLVHWTAQSKLNQPTVEGHTLVYSAGQSFLPSETEAWWQAYDLITIADKEIRTSNALLEELHLSPFHVRRVYGADSVRELSTQLRPINWKPVDAEVRVSDPIHLAKTLGGYHLYGRNPFVPFRELLQNAVDAVRARRLYESRPISWGQVRITIEPVDDQGRAWMHVDDNGIGMTERVLAGPLIDFGKSIWNSPVLREEFPGLQRRAIRPVGKFGIGFFSVFELGEEVRVISKHFHAGINEAKVLEFKSISNRPIIRAAQAGELPSDMSSRISVRIKNSDFLTEYDTEDTMFTRRVEDKESRKFSFSERVRKLVSFVDVQIYYLDKISSASFEHSSDVMSKTNRDIIDELYPQTTDNLREVVKTAHEALMTPILDDVGNHYGVAALYMMHDEGGG